MKVKTKNFTFSILIICLFSLFCFAQEEPQEPQKVKAFKLSKEESEKIAELYQKKKVILKEIEVTQKALTKKYLYQQAEEKPKPQSSFCFSGQVFYTRNCFVPPSRPTSDFEYLLVDDTEYNYNLYSNFTDTKFVSHPLIITTPYRSDFLDVNLFKLNK